MLFCLVTIASHLLLFFPVSGGSGRQVSHCGQPFSKDDYKAIKRSHASFLSGGASKFIIVNVTNAISARPAPALAAAQAESHASKPLPHVPVSIGEDILMRLPQNAHDPGSRWHAYARDHR